MLVGYVAFRDAGRPAQRPLFFLLFATFLMIVNMRWRRFSEYWPPFAVLFAAFAVEPHVAAARARYLGEGRAEEDGEDAARRPALEVENARAWEFVLVGTALVFLAAPMVWYTRVTSKDIAGMAGPRQYRGGMEWVRRPSARRAVSTHWDDFPKLFFYDPRAPLHRRPRPDLLLYRDPELMRHYERIGRGEEEDPVPIIRENFCLGEGDARRCPRYVITDPRARPLLRQRPRQRLRSTWSTRTATAPSSASATKKAKPAPRQTSARRTSPTSRTSRTKKW